MTVAGSLATRRDRATALSIADVEAIWTVLGSLSGHAIAPAPGETRCSARPDLPIQERCPRDISI